jgi:hypothetical protein
MRIEIVNKERKLVTDFELESNPFKVGEIINVKVSNHDKSFWTSEDFNEDFVIDKIEHFLRKDYTRAQKVSTVLTVSVEVSPV